MTKAYIITTIKKSNEMLAGIKGKYGNLWRIMLLAQAGITHAVYANSTDVVGAANVPAPSMVAIKVAAMGAVADANFLSAHKQLMAGVRQAGIERQARLSAHKQAMASIPAAVHKMMNKQTMAAIPEAAQKMMHRINLPATLPMHPTIRAGDVVIRDVLHTKLVYVLSDKGAIDWQGFSVGQHDKFIVHQKPNSILLNTVTGQAPSVIEGLLKSDGHLWLSNPYGIHTEAGTIDAKFLATTKLLSINDFVQGTYNFKGDSHAPITLSGTVTFARPGLWVLMAGERVHGKDDLLLAAPATRLILGGAESFSVDLNGDGLYGFKVDPEKASHGLSVQLDAQSKIQADRGYVLLTTQETIDTVANVINANGLIIADRVDTNPNTGVIHLRGGKGSNVTVGGKLSAVGHGTTGGKVYVEGSDILIDDALLDASGDLGGGQLAVGGKDLRAFRKNGNQSDGTFMMADNTTITKGSILKADALENGDGGKVEAWGTKSLTFKGSGSVHGGAKGGNGGFFELSTDGKLDIHGKGRIDRAAPHGKRGMLFIDPNNIYIISDGAPAPLMDAWIRQTDLMTDLGQGDVTLDTGNATAGSNVATERGTGILHLDPGGSTPAAGNITIYANLNLSNIDSNLVLNAWRDIVFDMNGGQMPLGNGNLYLNPALSGFGSLSFNGASSIAPGIRAGGVPCTGTTYLYTTDQAAYLAATPANSITTPLVFLNSPYTLPAPGSPPSSPQPSNPSYSSVPPTTAAILPVVGKSTGGIASNFGGGSTSVVGPSNFGGVLSGGVTGGVKPLLVGPPTGAFGGNKLGIEVASVAGTSSIGTGGGNLAGTSSISTGGGSVAGASSVGTEGGSIAGTNSVRTEGGSGETRNGGSGDSDSKSTSNKNPTSAITSDRGDPIPVDPSTPIPSDPTALGGGSATKSKGASGTNCMTSIGENGAVKTTCSVSIK
jgi:filamentous hemagglutinin family protein